MSVFCFALLCGSAHSASQSLGEEKGIFRGASCPPNASCTEVQGFPNTLKEFGFRVKHWRLPAATKTDFDVFNTSVYAWYETVGLAQLPDFAFVQYVRGCVYESEQGGDGVVTIRHGVMHQVFGKHRLFLHRDWTVNSPTTDPLFGSDPRNPLRHYFMESNKSPEQFPTSHGTYYGDSAPKNPRLFMLFSPTTPAYARRSDIGDTAVNHSLEYRTCLYRTSDIPSTSDGTVIPGAIGCFDWKSSYVYDQALRKFASPGGIVAACRPNNLPDLSILDDEKK